MPDKDKVIKGLELCKKFKPGECLGCPYYPSFNCLTNLHDDAIALLKEQETPEPIIHGPMEEYWGEEEICPDCGKRWQSLDVDTTHYCPGCGRSVKWE